MVFELDAPAFRRKFHLALLSESNRWGCHVAMSSALDLLG